MNATNGAFGVAFSSDDSLPTAVPGGKAGALPAELFSDSGESATMGSMRTARGGAGSDGPALGRIDQYDLVRKLGGGGFGVVYLARDTVSGIEVALKTLHPLLKTNAEEMDQLREKFALVARLTHQNIAKALVLHPCRAIDVWDDAAKRELRLSPGDSVMVMDYAPGTTLSKWRKQFSGGRVPPDLALEVARQIASALDYAHGEKIVHRDVKPGNVMVETVAAEPPKIRVRLLDFGLAAEIRSSMSRVSTEQGDTSGTRPYMAPEQWLGRKQDGRTDQYALACVLYELLSGAPPFTGVFETGDPVIMMAAVKGEAPEEIEGLDGAVNAALLRALAKDPKARFGSCEEFVESCLAQSPRSPQRESRTEEQRPGASNPEGPQVPKTAAALESDVLRRKLAFARDLKAVPGAVRADAEFSKCVSLAEDELAVAEEACKFGRFAAAAESLNRVESALDALRKARFAREQAERKAKEEAERIAREKAEAELKAKKEGGPSRTGEPQGGGGLQSAVGANGGLEAAAPLAGTRTVVRVGSQEIALRWCPPGSFLMGSPETEEGRENYETQHRVTLTKGFWMGETEVTQELWQAIMGKNPSHFLDRKVFFFFGGKTSPNRPVDSVSWNDCQDFLRNLNAKAPAGWRFALPTEAQWEYACRAGTTGAYGGSGNLDEMGWYYGNSGNETHPVAQKRPNAWGLYDMHGNVWEWCSDWYGPNPSGAVTDPTGGASGGYRVLRGGGSWYDPRYCRSAIRFWDDPGFPDRGYGFRLLAFQDGK